MTWTCSGCGYISPSGISLSFAQQATGLCMSCRIAAGWTDCTGTCVYAGSVQPNGVCILCNPPTATQQLTLPATVSNFVCKQCGLNIGSVSSSTAIATGLCFQCRANWGRCVNAQCAGFASLCVPPGGSCILCSQGTNHPTATQQSTLPANPSALVVFAFSEGDQVMLDAWSAPRNSGVVWVEAMSKHLGKIVVLRERLVAKVPVWCIHLDGAGYVWAESGMTKVGVSLDEETTAPGVSAGKPEWLISRTACLDERECKSCGAPKPCAYHDPPVSADWSFIGGKR